VDALARALVLGCPQGYVRVFADDGAPLARLVAAQKAETRRRPRRPTWLPGRGAAGVRRPGRPARRRAGRRCGGAGPGGAADCPRAGGAGAAGRGHAEPADRRAAGGHPGHGEKHVSHLLGKRGAANRTQAVTQARQLGLIPWPAPSAESPPAPPCPRARPAGTAVPAAAPRRFHPHVHLRVTPHGGSNSYRSPRAGPQRAGLPAIGAHGMGDRPRR
jgi:hypothetical protein